MGATSESLNSGQYFQRTPNNNLVQKTHVGAHGGGVYGNRQYTDSQRYGYNNQFNNQGSQVSYSNRNQLFNTPSSYSQNQRYGGGSFNQNSNTQRSQNQFTNQNQIYQNQLNSQNQRNQKFNQVNQYNQRSQNQFNQQNQRFNQLTQQNQRFNQMSSAFNQKSQNLNQRNQAASQFSHRSHGFNQQSVLPYSANNNQFTNRQQQPFRQGRDFQDQEIQQGGQRTDDGRFILLCPASVAVDYLACQLRCQALSSCLESKCLLEAWANRNKACWNGNPNMICPA